MGCLLCYSFANPQRMCLLFFPAWWVARPLHFWFSLNGGHHFRKGAKVLRISNQAHVHRNQISVRVVKQKSWELRCMDVNVVVCNCKGALTVSFVMTFLLLYLEVFALFASKDVAYNMVIEPSEYSKHLSCPFLYTMVKKMSMPTSVYLRSKVTG